MIRIDKTTPLGGNIHYFLKWTFISCVIGLMVGAVGAVFSIAVRWVTAFWESHSWTLFLAPAAGVLIVWLYRTFHEEGNKGTNLVLESISSNEEVSLATAPLIFISTLLTHFVSASAGREGAALQLGGSLGNQIGKLLRLDEKDKKVAVMCGMSACFAALFGTPMAAGIFSLEVVSIGVLYYAALVPCVFSAFIGAAVSEGFGNPPEQFLLGAVPEFGITEAVLTVILGVLCALLSMAFCVLLHRSEKLYHSRIPNGYARIAVGGVLLIVLTLLSGSRDYNGSGMELIGRIMGGETVSYLAFFWKMIFTAVVLGAGFKGGEIVPTLCVGAAFGATMARIAGLDQGLCAACSMAALFAGVTNCPIATVILAFELFGYGAMPYFAIIVAVSFTLSGYYGLYKSQKFVYSKLKAEYINIRSK